MDMSIIGISVVSAVSVTITVQQTQTINGQVQTMPFCLTKAQEAAMTQATGVEQVFIQNGLTGYSYPLLTRLANIFYADRLKSHFKYRLAFGNNGLPQGIPHFVNLNTPHCAMAYNPANQTLLQADVTPQAAQLDIAPKTVQAAQMDIAPKTVQAAKGGNKNGQ